AVGFISVQMIETISVAVPEKISRSIGNENGSVLRLDVLVMPFRKQYFQLAATLRVVFYELQFVLIAIQFHDVNGFSVGTPGQVGEVFFFGSTGFQIHGFAARRIKNSRFWYLCSLP